MPDPLSRYEQGLSSLLDKLGQEHARYAEALTFQARLGENIAQARQYGDTELRRAERAQIVENLNRLAISAIKVSYNELCGLESVSTSEPSTMLDAELALPQASDQGVQTWWGEKYYGQFVGHDRELVRLLDLLTKPDAPSILAITAMGGMGKTAFCRELVERAHKQGSFADIAWVRARLVELEPGGKPTRKRYSRLTVEEAIEEICIELHVPHRHALDPVKLRQRLSTVLNEERYLIVVDGLEDAESPQTISRELSRILGRSQMLLTSREKARALVTEFKLRKLNREESRQFVWQVASEQYAIPEQNPLRYTDESQIESMLEVTDGMPLAMKLIISQADFLDMDRLVRRLEDVQVEKVLYDYIFDESWAELQRDGDRIAQELLILLAGRGRPVPVHLLYDLREIPPDKIDLALTKLARYSLVEITLHTPGQRQVGLHSLTRHYVNETLRQRYK